ncbi:MAG: response regulator [Hydrogenophaga sp.]|uniref:response regulator n=1 Tax=Hydrogenophaga sp. TaxID=1904254 RepID=UPI000EE6570D|nr:response regulator [Hydrogenophaga sp.]MDD3786058.1 response regulator [Hydrogenophaga sp.]HAJ11744.1 two-component system response regulator [Comamonadaceae bacterium]
MNKHASPILLVEDNPDDAELTRLALARHGLDQRVVHVSDGMQALDYLYRRGKFDARTTVDPQLVLLDLKMPLLDGIGVLKEIKGSELLRNIPVVILTSSTEPSDLQRAYDAGTNAYIAKPTEFAQFLSAMKHVCEFWVSINQIAPRVPGGARASNFGELI